MTTEEVIAISKTLRPELMDITYFSSGPPSMTWLIQYRDKHFYGETIEETLRSAGWDEPCMYCRNRGFLSDQHDKECAYTHPPKHLETGWKG